MNKVLQLVTGNDSQRSFPKGCLSISWAATEDVISLPSWYYEMKCAFDMWILTTKWTENPFIAEFQNCKMFKGQSLILKFPFPNMISDFISSFDF